MADAGVTIETRPTGDADRQHETSDGQHRSRALTEPTAGGAGS